MIKILLLFLSLSFYLYPQGNQKPSRPMLWEVSASHLKKPSYLFGTFHTRNTKINTLPLSVLNALKNTQTLYTEIKLSSLNQHKSFSFMKSKKRIPLQERLSKQTYQQLLQFIKKYTPQIKLHHLAVYKTWAIALMIGNQRDITLYSDGMFMDEKLVHLAKKHNITNLGLETPLEQLSYFDNLTDTESELFLQDMMHQHSDSSYQDALTRWYLKGQATGFTDLQEKFHPTNIAQQKLDKKLLNGLLYNRNKLFLKRIHKLLINTEDYAYFFAIGAGHLSDSKGLVAQLKSLGYTLTPID